MTTQWQPFREPIGRTIRRTVVIALVIGAVLARAWGGGIGRWPLTTLVALWPSFGGHWIEVWFLDWLRPRLPIARGVQIAARIVVWFLGGSVLGLGMARTAMALTHWRPVQMPAWWLGGLAFIGIELVAHLPLQLFGRPNFYDGRG